MIFVRGIWSESVSFVIGLVEVSWKIILCYVWSFCNQHFLFEYLNGEKITELSSHRSSLLFNFIILQIGKHEVPVNCEAVACTVKNASCKAAVQNLLIM